MFSCEPPKDATDDCYLDVDSERNGYGYLLTHVREFLTRHVIFCVSKFSEETLLQFWQCLDVPADVAGVLVEHRVMFVDGHLQVSVEFKNDQDLMERLSGALLSLAKFERFTVSRWLQVGTQSKVQIACLAIGIEHWFGLVLADKKCSKFHIGGFRTLQNDGVRRFLLIAALSSWPMDTFMRLVLTDDRLAMHAPEYRAAVLEELEYLCHIMPSVWQLLVCVTGLDLQPGHVRDLVLRSANVSVAYLLDRCLDDAEGLPWSLCVGNIQDNLQSLVAGRPPVPGSTAAKLSVLVRLGFNSVVLEEAVQCIGHVKFSTITAEQLHGSIAVCHNAHPEYEQIALRRKSHRHCCNQGPCSC